MCYLWYHMYYDIMVQNMISYSSVWYHIVLVISLTPTMISYNDVICLELLFYCTGYMISQYDITAYGIIGVCHFFKIFFGYPCIKKITNTLWWCKDSNPGLQPWRQSIWPLNQWLTELYYNQIIGIIYIFWLKTRHVGASSAAPQCSQTPPMQ